MTPFTYFFVVGLLTFLLLVLAHKTWRGAENKANDLSVIGIIFVILRIWANAAQFLLFSGGGGFSHERRRGVRNTVSLCDTGHVIRRIWANVAQQLLFLFLWGFWHTRGGWKRRRV